MWHNKLEQADSRYLMFARRDNGDFDGKYPFSNNETKIAYGCFYNLKKTLETKRIVFKVLNEKFNYKALLNDIQKVLLVSDYMASTITYSDYAIGKNGIRIDFDDMHEASFSLKNNHAVCEGQSEAFMLLLNNPIMRVQCRSIVGLSIGGDYSSDHQWNIVQPKESQYYFMYDPTWIENTQSLKYAFAVSPVEREAFLGVDGKYNFSPKKLPDDFLKQQLEEAKKRISNQSRIIINRNLDELLDIYYNDEHYDNSNVSYYRR